MDRVSLKLDDARSIGRYRNGSILDGIRVREVAEKIG